MEHMPLQLREVSTVRAVGFKDAVNDLGTHFMCGQEVPYTRAQVYKVLQGKHKSKRLLERIAERRPDLFSLRYVADEVKAWYESYQESYQQN